jgi:acyl-CoA synthetase (NDP forming)
VKSGRNTVVPALAANSVPVDEASVAALFEQSGLIRVETLPQLLDTALLLANQPLPRGPRVAVVGNSSAIGLLAADAALTEGLELAAAPVDVGAGADQDTFAAAVAESLRRTEVDALIVVFVPPVAVPGTSYARTLREVVAKLDESRHKPIASTFLAVEGIPEDLGLPSYPSPERAAQALARVTRYARWRTAPRGEFVRPAGVDPGAARAIAGRERMAELSDDEVRDLLSCYGIDIVPYRRVSDVDEAVAAAAELGFPVAMKATGVRFWRRTDLVGVRLDLGTSDAVRAGYADLRIVSEVDDVYVQRMAPKGTACAIGLQEDPSFGALVSFGLSGVISDLVGDRAYRAVPLTDNDAAALVRAPRAAPLLTGYGGAPPADLDALAGLVLRVNALAEDLPEVRWLSLEPILASAGGAHVTGARITVGPPPSQQDVGPRRMRATGITASG